MTTRTFKISDPHDNWTEIWREITEYEKETGQKVITKINADGLVVTAPDDHSTMWILKFA